MAFAKIQDNNLLQEDFSFALCYHEFTLESYGWRIFHFGHDMNHLCFRCAKCFFDMGEGGVPR
jgi:hypothetical protein